MGYSRGVTFVCAALLGRENTNGYVNCKMRLRFSRCVLMSNVEQINSLASLL